MDRFFEEENVRRYRKLRNFGTDEAQRAPILKQLAEEFEQFRCEIADVGNAGRELRVAQPTELGCHSAAFSFCRSRYSVSPARATSTGLAPPDTSLAGRT